LAVVADLSSEAKWLIMALVALPFALWLLLAGRKRSQDNQEEHYEYNYEEAAANRQALRTRIQHQQAHHEEELDPLESTWEADANTLFEETPREFAGVVATNPEYEQAIFERRAQPRTPSPKRTTDADQGFAQWLQSQPWETQQSLAIEFLIYWMAYSDDRYDPSLKERIFQASDPNTHDIVKRWVLMEDVHAFADAVEWLQHNTTAQQQQQVLILLMSLLVNGNTPSPVQNTMLRFLGDVFHMHNPSVEEQFELDFGLPIPPIPRVDRVAWWQRQLSSVVVLWDARGLSASDSVTQAAAQLGVSADSDIEHIEAAYERAIKRCRSDRFDQLGDRELQLVAGRRTRLVEARDELLKALV